MEFKIKVLIEKEAEIRVLKKLYLIIISKILKKRRIKEFKKLIKAVYTTLAVYTVLAFLNI
jgi:uncharacterized protein (UPF0128 family)